jgi:N-acetylglucosamine-6-phosphate deacetylase
LARAWWNDFIAGDHVRRAHEAALCRAQKSWTVARESSAGLCNGARVLGAHVEGPFFNMQMRGCHLPEYIKNPSDRLQAFGEAIHEHIGIFVYRRRGWIA